MRISRPVAPLLLAVALTAGLVACSTPSIIDTPQTQAPQTEEETTPTPEAPQASGDYVTASFANPVTNPGELLTTFGGTNFQVDVYQVGNAAATKTGFFANPDTNKPIIDVGAELVFVNYVVTNTSDEDIPLSYSLVSVDARYADWPYLQGMDSITDSALWESMGVNTSAIAVGVGDAPFAWEPGTSFSIGSNFLYQANSPITFQARLTPADEAGDLVHDLRQEVEVESTIK